MTTSKRLHALGFSVLSTAALLLTLFATLPAKPLQRNSLYSSHLGQVMVKREDLRKL